MDYRLTGYQGKTYDASGFDAELAGILILPYFTAKASPTARLQWEAFAEVQGKRGSDAYRSITQPSAHSTQFFRVLRPSLAKVIANYDGGGLRKTKQNPKDQTGNFVKLVKEVIRSLSFPRGSP